MRTSPSLTILAAFAAVAALAIAGPARLSADRESAAARKPVPAFSMTDAKGHPVKLSAYKGKVVALNFWATWCTGCKLEIPWLVEFDKKYRNRGFATIGVALDDEGWQTVKPYVTKNPISYPIALASFDVLEKPLALDPVLPATLLIDRAGNIAETHTGVIKKEEFEARLEALLDEKVK